MQRVSESSDATLSLNDSDSFLRSRLPSIRPNKEDLRKLSNLLSRPPRKTQSAIMILSSIPVSSNRILIFKIASSCMMALTTVKEEFVADLALRLATVSSIHAEAPKRLAP